VHRIMGCGHGFTAMKLIADCASNPGCSVSDSSWYEIDQLVASLDKSLLDANTRRRKDCCTIMISWREDWRRACLNRRVAGRAADKATRHAKRLQVSRKAERQRISINNGSSSGVSSSSGNSSGSAAAWQHGST
jgi:hypothetical protein